MGDVLNEAYSLMQCKECPWYKSCVVPMRFTTEDLRRQMEASPGLNMPAPDTSMQNFLSSMAAAAQNSLLEGCPVFIDRLRNNPGLALRIKQIMQNWSQEEAGKEDSGPKS